MRRRGGEQLVLYMAATTYLVIEPACCKERVICLRFINQIRCVGQINFWGLMHSCGVGRAAADALDAQHGWTERVAAARCARGRLWQDSQRLQLKAEAQGAHHIWLRFSVCTHCLFLKRISSCPAQQRGEGESRCHRANRIALSGIDKLSPVSCPVAMLNCRGTWSSSFY